MNYNQFISSEQSKIQIQTYNELPQLHDPYIRRYHLHSIFARTSQLFIVTWWIRLLTQNAMRRSFKSFGIWLQAAVALHYAKGQIDDRFYIASIKAKNTVKELQKSYEREHYKDSQFWH